jgi:hypothetical protein
MGGAIYIQCKNDVVGLDHNCFVRFVAGNKFLNNFSEVDGGAIKYVANKYEGEKTILFFNNTALYGANTASYPYELKINFIANNDYYNPNG